MRLSSDVSMNGTNIHHHPTLFWGFFCDFWHWTYLHTFLGLGRLTLLEILEIFWKCAKSPGNFSG